MIEIMSTAIPKTLYQLLLAFLMLPPLAFAAGGPSVVYLAFKKAGVIAELHVYAGAGHGFGLRPANRAPAGSWPDRFKEWLADRNFLGKP